MQVYTWLTLTSVLICLMFGKPWTWYSDEMVMSRQLSSRIAATETTLQALQAQLSTQHEATLQAVRAQLSGHHAATEATLQAVRAQLSAQQAAFEATLQAVRAQARLLAAHSGGPVPTEQPTAWQSITEDPPHSEAPAVSIKC